MLGRLVPTILGAAIKINNSIIGTVYSNTRNALTTPSASTLPGIFISVRTKVRDYFPRPKEIKRSRYNYEARLKTANGRKTIMRKILKGKFVLGH